MRKDFALCFNDGYTPYASVTILSVMQHMHLEDEVHIHILSDFISEKNQKLLKQLGNVHIYLIKEDSLKGLKTALWSVYAWYRILLPSLLEKSIQKVLYLDCDIIVNDSLDDLFAIDMKNYSVGGCIDIQSYNQEVYTRLEYDSSKQYICSGVLMMNLERWRQTKLSDRMIEYALHHEAKIEYPDQDTINYVCQDDKIVFPCRYGVIVPFFRDLNFIKEHLDEMETLMTSPAIVHYAGYAPWVYVKDKSLHSNLWWDTCHSLQGFNQIRWSYGVSIIKYGVRYVLSKLGLLKSTNKYSLSSQYYNHPRVSEAQVRLLMAKVFQTKDSK